jgi:hypothetical protein
MSTRHLLPLLLLALVPAPDAHAQFQWRDANGRMVYSDLPPPVSVPPRSVLNAPAGQAPAGMSGGSGETAAAGPASAVAPAPGARPPSAADRELQYQKRRLERAESERKAAEAATQARRVSAACEDSRNEIRTMESGMRMASVNERGEREVVTEAERQRRLDAAHRQVRELCKG